MYNRAGPVKTNARRHRRLSLSALLCAALMVSASAQTPQNSARPNPTPTPPPHATGLIMGQVVDASGAPVASAVVSMSGALNAVGLPPGPGQPPFGQRRMLTNADGRFLFTGLPKGTYSFDVTKSGYISSGPGKLRFDGTSQPIELADGERNGSVKITMWKYGVISGTLTDDAGEPFVGATIWSLRRSYTTGRSQMTDGPSAFTDDRGYFRLVNLPPGDYMICVVASQTTLPAALVDAHGQARLAGGAAASDISRSFSPSTIGFAPSTSTAGIRMGDFVVQTVGNFSRGMVPPGPDETGRFMSFQTTFYPGVVNMAQADVIRLASGEERAGANIRLKLVPLSMVAGTLMGPTGPLPNVGVRLSPEYSSDLGNELSFEAALTVSDASGRFAFMGVPAGQYVLRALKVPVAPTAQVVDNATGRTGPAPIPPEPTLWANVPITVSGEAIPDLTVKVSTGFRISGKVVFESAASKQPPPLPLQSTTFQLIPADGHQIGYVGALRGRSDNDGTFMTYEVPPGRYIMRYTGAWAGWALKSILYQGRDVSVAPLDLAGDVSGVQIVLTDKPIELSGFVRDESGKIDPKAAVLIFPVDRNEWTTYGEAPRRLGLTRASSTGEFRFRGIPGGQYLIAAVPDGQAGDWQNPSNLELLSRIAVPLSLTDGEKKVQDVVSRRIK